MSLTAEQNLQTDYVSWQMRRLKDAVNHFNHLHTVQPAGIMGYLFAYHWLREEIHPHFRKNVVAVFRKPEHAYLQYLLLETPTAEDFITGYLNHWENSTARSTTQHQVQQWLNHHADTMAIAVKVLLAEWQKFGLFRHARMANIRKIQKDQKAIHEAVGGPLDRERLQLVDQQPDTVENIAHFPKLGVIPHMACPQSCRHCMFVWRPPMKNLPNPRRIFNAINQHTAHILFTGGDLTQHMEEFYRAIQEMGKIETFAILLNGSFATSVETTQTFFQSLQIALNKRPQPFCPAHVVLQISFDEYHQEILADHRGRLTERIPVANIANIVACSVDFPHIQLSLLHKQNRLNFSTDLFRHGVFARLARDLDQRGMTVSGLDWEASPRIKADPVKPSFQGGVILNAAFTLVSHPDHPIHLMSSTLDAYGRAALLDPSEYINEKLYLQEILKNGPPHGERFDTDLMFWFDGAVTCFSATHLWLGNFFKDGEQVFQRQRKDPLLKSLARFDTRLLDYFEQWGGDRLLLQQQATSPHHLFHQITQSAEARLFMTQCLLKERYGHLY